ncbi:MAG: hypothetical protein N3G20_01820, partial [Verrucomicrobiae bacterium]|nr:hypothetical protein [Verrucomicrobiae bacterium]
PGHWYLGILNRETNTVQYVLRVVERTAYSEVPIQLAVPVAVAAMPGNDTCTYYVLDLNVPVPALQFQLYNATGNARILINRNSRPGPSDALFSLDASPLAPANLLICPDAQLPDLRGIWYIAVISRDPIPVTSTLAASVAHSRTTTLLSGIVTTGVAPQLGTGSDCVPEIYQFTVLPNATSAEFVLTPHDGNVDLFIRKGGAPSVSLFDYFSSEPGLLQDRVRVSTNSVPVPITGGDWFAYVHNADSHPVTYSLLATQFIGDMPVGMVFEPVITMTGGVVTLRWIATPGLKFKVQYATQIGPSGTFLWIDIPGFVTSTNNVYTFTDDGSLTGGYAPVKFYRVLLVGGTPVDASVRVNISVSNNVVTLWWTSLPGLKFRVQYANQIPASGTINWIDVPGTVTSTAGSYQFIDDGSQTGGAGKTRFYRIVLMP